MELRQLKYFVAVAEHQHFGKAAEQLFVSQPALSQQIRLLEENLGVELLDGIARKNFRRVKLTEAGEFFFIEAKKLLNQAKKLQENTKKLAESTSSIQVGVYKALLKERIVEFMESYKAEHPNVQIKISEYDNYLEVQEAISNKEVDIGLTLLPLTEGLKYKVLKTGKVSLIMSKSHPLAQTKIDIHELLKNEKWIELNRKVHPVYKEIEDRCSTLGIQRQIVQEVTSLNLLISLVGLGAGIGFAPSLFDFSTEPNIVSISLEDTIFKDIEICHVVSWKN